MYHQYREFSSNHQLCQGFGVVFKFYVNNNQDRPLKSLKKQAGAHGGKSNKFFFYLSIDYLPTDWLSGGMAQWMTDLPISTHVERYGVKAFSPNNSRNVLHFVKWNIYKNVAAFSILRRLYVKGTRSSLSHLLRHANVKSVVKWNT